MTRFLAIVICGLLVGCGGGSSSPPTLAPAKDAAPANPGKGKQAKTVPIG